MCVAFQDPCLTMDDPVGTYAPYEEGLAKGVYIMEADGVTPLSGKVSIMRGASSAVYSHQKSSNAV